MSKHSSRKLAIGAAVGITAGFIAGILTAPKSGKETRKDIKAATNKFTRESEKKLKALHADLSDLLAKGKVQAKKQGANVKSELLKAMHKAEKAQKRVKEVITAIRNGEADHPELDKAVKDAAEAKKHLLQYLRQTK